MPGLLGAFGDTCMPVSPSSATRDRLWRRCHVAWWTQLTRCLEGMVVLLDGCPQLKPAFPPLPLHVVHAHIEQLGHLRDGQPALRQPLEGVLLGCSVEPLPQGGGLVGAFLLASQLRELQDTLGNAEWIRTIGHILSFLSNAARSARAA